MPFGLTSASASFQRALNRILRGADRNTSVYIDDIICFNETWQDHLKTLREVLSRLRTYNLNVTLQSLKLNILLAT